MNEIVEMGHEIGYHYEEFSLAKGVGEKAIKLFDYNLSKMRELYDVKTMCMHGSPLSKWDNKTLWEVYNYRLYDILADISFDIDFREIFYITDTGRSWNKFSSNIRDSVDANYINIPIRNSFHLLELIINNKLPQKIMINTHPQRWSDSFLTWAIELVFQNLRNIGKIFLKRVRKYEKSNTSISTR